VAQWSNPLRSLEVATVKGTLIHGMPVAFAGSRRNVGLGRSFASVVGLVPLQTVAPATTGVLWRNEEGNVVSVRQAHALDVKTPKKRLHKRGHVLRSVQRPVHVRSLARVTRSVRYRGRENLRKQEEPSPGSERTDASAARRSSPLLGVTREGRA
jgi:hypothetical protein